MLVVTPACLLDVGSLETSLKTNTPRGLLISYSWLGSPILRSDLMRPCLMASRPSSGLEADADRVTRRKEHLASHRPTYGGSGLLEAQEPLYATVSHPDDHHMGSIRQLTGVAGDELRKVCIRQRQHRPDDLPLRRGLQWHGMRFLWSCTTYLIEGRLSVLWNSCWHNWYCSNL